MSEFEKEYNDLGFRAQALDAVLADKDIVENFKDWQPPKPLVVVPQIVADFIEVRKKSLKLYDAFQEIEECYCGDLYNFVCQKRNGQDLFARAWIDGYTVEKEKLYLLKHIEISNRDTTINCYLTHTFTAPFIGHTNFSKGYDMYDVKECHFTQSEIDDMEIGSYEKIPVEMSDNGI